ncbi:aldo/keto reductase [Kitasatospora sp. NPDC002040]|uniref:aldo/keto reductase n=1 Tax=Kitasatospora sp. NPDC002040 TaxID=3154661 RepID=UPI003328EF16
MQYRTIGTDPKTRREVSVLSLGAMLFGTRTDEATAFAVLDRYVEAGGNFIDTSNNYAYWLDDSRGGASEQVLGNWRRSRGITDEVVIATKLGARPKTAGTGYVENREGLSAQAIRTEAEESRKRLGVDKLDLLYAHVEDPGVELAETVGAFGELVDEGTVGLLGVSNHWAWRVEQARTLAARSGVAGYEVLQYSHSYYRRRADLPGTLTTDGEHGVVTGELLSYLRRNPGLTLVAYSPLLGGSYGNEAAKPLPPVFDHAGTRARRIALDQVVAETGATHNQVVLAWLLGGDLPVIPLTGASSLAQLEESLAALDLELSADQRARLDSAG